MQTVQCITSLLIMILFSTQLNGMKDAIVTYQKELYMWKGSHMMRVIAFCGGQEVGRLVPFEGICNRVGELWVAENMRNKGIGKTLLNLFAEYGEKQKWAYIVGYIKPNDPIQEYFKKLANTHRITIAHGHPRYLTIEMKFPEVVQIKSKML